MKRLVCVLAAICLTGCVTEIDTSNPVFARFAQFKTKNLSLANVRALETWFLQHKDAADKINQLCKARQDVGQAWYWPVTVEGRICIGAGWALRSRK